METRYDRANKAFLILDEQGNDTEDSISFKFLDSYKENNHEDEPLTDFSFEIYYQKGVRESNYRTLYLHDTSLEDNRKIIGMMIPFSALITEDEEMRKNKDLSCYVFHSYQYLLKQEDFQDVVDYDSMSDIISERYADTCLCVYHLPSCPLEIHSKLEISMAKYGYYKTIKDYTNPKIDLTERIVLRPCDGILEADGNPFDQYLFDCIRTHLNEKDPVLKFLYLYQIIESFFTRIVVQDLEGLIAEVKNPAGALKDMSDSLKIRKEINRWTTIEERAQIKGAEHAELDEKCRQFLTSTDANLKHPQSIYSVRNHIIHRFRVAIIQVELLKEINFLFELYLIDVLCRYKES